MCTELFVFASRLLFFFPVHNAEKDACVCSRNTTHSGGMLRFEWLFAVTSVLVMWKVVCADDLNSCYCAMLGTRSSRGGSKPVTHHGM